MLLGASVEAHSSLFYVTQSCQLALAGCPDLNCARTKHPLLPMAQPTLMRAVFDLPRRRSLPFSGLRPWMLLCVIDHKTPERRLGKSEDLPRIRVAEAIGSRGVWFAAQIQNRDKPANASWTACVTLKKGRVCSHSPSSMTKQNFRISAPRVETLVTLILCSEFRLQADSLISTARR